MDHDSIPASEITGADRKPFTFWLYLIAGGATLLFLACAGSCGYSSYLGRASVEVASQRVDEMLAVIEQGNFDQAYDTELSSGCRQTSPREQYVQMVKRLKENLGPLKSKKIQSFLREIKANKTYLNASYHAEFEKGRGGIRITLVWEDDRWKFQEFNVQSTALNN